MLHSSTECVVDPRQALAAVPEFLAHKYGVEFHYRTAVTEGGSGSWILSRGDVDPGSADALATLLARQGIEVSRASASFQACGRTYRPGDYITLIGYWRVDGDVPPDVRLFTHLLFDPQEIAAQSDTISVSVPQLQPRDVFVQITFLQVPQALPDGRYRLSIGAYEDKAGADQDVRLPVFDGNRPRGTRVFLTEIAVAKPK